MKLRFIALIAVLVVGAVGLFVFGRQMGADQAAAMAGRVPAGSEATSVAHPADDPVARGQYLVIVGGCNDCHTPWILGPKGPEPDMTRMLSGHPAGMELPPAPVDAGPWTWAAAGTNTAFAGPWGVSFAANLTPDENTGMGIWTEETFVKTLRTGRHWGQSRQILPPMPWPNYARMTDDDLKAMFAYLRTVPPIQNQVPEPLPPGAPASEAAGG